MKKVIAVITILSLVSFASCRAISMHNENSSCHNVDTSIADNRSYFKNESELLDSSQLISFAQPNPLHYDTPQVYDLTNGSVDDFIAWCKYSVGDHSVDQIYTDNTKFLSYIRNSGKIIVPKMTNKEFLFYRTCLTADAYGCSYDVWYMDKDYKKFIFGIHPITEISDYKSLKSSSVYKDSVDYEVDRGVCKYGQYYVGVKTDDSDKRYSVLFVVDNFLVQLFIDDMEWSPDYFDYFDFETVSLE